jgi:hypothetical protein
MLEFIEGQTGYTLRSGSVVDIKGDHSLKQASSKRSHGYYKVVTVTSLHVGREDSKTSQDAASSCPTGKESSGSTSIRQIDQDGPH